MRFKAFQQKSGVGEVRASIGRHYCDEGFFIFLFPLGGLPYGTVRYGTLFVKRQYVLYVHRKDIPGIQYLFYITGI